MADNNINNRRIAKNTLFLYLRMILVLVVSLYTTRVVLNALGAVDYGIHNVVAGFVSMFVFLNTSMSNGIQRFYNFTLGKEGEEGITKVYNMALLIQVILALIVVVLLETVGLWYLEVKMVIPIDRMSVARWIYQFSVISFVLVIMQIPYNAAIMAHERMDYYAFVSIVDVGLKLAVALMIPYACHDKLLVYGAYIMIIHIVNFLMYYIYSKLNFKSIKLKKSFHKDIFKEMVSFSGWNVVGTFAYMLKNQGLNVLLNAFFGPVVNAARGVSVMISGAIHGFQGSIVTAFRPQTVQSYAAGNYSRVKSLMFSLSKISYLMLFLLSMPVIIELPYILHLWLGNEVPNYTVSFTMLILVNMIIGALNTPITQVIHATGRIRNYQIGTSIVMCSILPISWFFLKAGGSPITVYAVSLCVTCVNQMVCMQILKQEFSYSIIEYLKSVLVPCFLVSFVAVIIPIILHFVMPMSFIRLVFVTFTGVGCVIISAYFIALNLYEKEMVVDFVKKTLKKYQKTN